MSRRPANNSRGGFVYGMANEAVHERDDGNDQRDRERALEGRGLEASRPDGSRVLATACRAGGGERGRSASYGRNSQRGVHTRDPRRDPAVTAVAYHSSPWRRST